MWFNFAFSSIEIYECWTCDMLRWWWWWWRWRKFLFSFIRTNTLSRQHTTTAIKLFRYANNDVVNPQFFAQCIWKNSKEKEKRKTYENLHILMCHGIDFPPCMKHIHLFMEYMACYINVSVCVYCIGTKYVRFG